MSIIRVSTDGTVTVRTKSGRRIQTTLTLLRSAATYQGLAGAQAAGLLAQAQAAVR